MAEDSASSASRPTCFVVGPLPPPTHGFSIATAAMAAVLRQAGLNPHIVDTAADGVVAKVRKRIAGLAALWRHRGRALSVYVAVSGGKGQFGDLLFVAAGRLLKARIVLHHHTFEYLTNPRLRARWLARCAGPAAVHIVLCGRMAELLRQVYPQVRRTIVLSNAALLPAPVKTEMKKAPLQAIGFLGTVSREKGIDRFLMLVGLLRAGGLQVQGHVAGLCQDAQILRLLEAGTADGSIVYHGLVQGETKAEFLARIDVLVFPSRLNEAEPLVIIEALAAGIPVVTVDRGCISALIDSGVGQLLDASSDDLAPAAARIAGWISAPDELAAARRAASARAQELARGARQTLRTVLTEFGLQ